MVLITLNNIDCIVEDKHKEIFEDLDKWCKEVGGSEYREEYLINNPNVVREKIDLMLKKNIITIIK